MIDVEAWWRQVGPSRFIQDIFNAVEKTPVVGIAVPSGRLGDKDSTISYEVSKLNESIVWLDVQIDADCSDVFAETVHQVVLQSETLKIKVAADLLTPVLDKTVISFDQETIQLHHRKLFPVAAAFAAAARRNNRVQRPTLVFNLPPNFLDGGDLAVMGDDRATIISYKGYIRRHDMIGYVSSIMRDRKDNFISNEILVSIVAHTATWDPMIASLLACGTVDDILNPWHFLSSTFSYLQPLPRVWEAGTFDTLDGHDAPHPLWMVNNGKRDDFDRLIWSAHLAEFYPWLERMRLKLLKIMIEDIRRGATKLYGNEDVDLQTLELGDMCKCIWQVNRKDEFWDFLYSCKKARDDLAHLRPIPRFRLELLRNSPI